MTARKIVAIIPARYGSSRFEGKPLATIAGRPMVEWVARRVARSALIDEVIVAVDDVRVEAACRNAGLRCLMTRSDHATSTERLNEVAETVRADLYIAVNGDEPLINREMVEKVIPESWPEESPYVSNLTCRMSSPAEVVDPSNIKVIWRPDGHAVYFSRSPVPYPKGFLDFDYYKHIGVIAYNRRALKFFAQTARGPIERAEDINELRFIENDVPLRMIVVDAGLGLSVDTPKDLEQVRRIVAERRISLQGEGGSD